MRSHSWISRGHSSELETYLYFRMVKDITIICFTIFGLTMETSLCILFVNLTEICWCFRWRTVPVQWSTSRKQMEWYTECQYINRVHKFWRHPHKTFTGKKPKIEDTQKLMDWAWIKSDDVYCYSIFSSYLLSCSVDCSYSLTWSWVSGKEKAQQW